ncbi:MAG TPA: TetR family transcriptional regulator [Bryobacteraceae bacterium]|nr:TetR family transcriptional regulator [Bryobacteraceae bacterium]
MHAKSAETRSRILEAAMDLFRRQGFEETTMREIAAEAAVATGAAYYYFDSKDAIALAFYDQAQQDLEPLIGQALAGGKHLRDRLGALLEAKLKYFEPNRRLLGALAAHADPEHPLSPFSARTREIRERDVASFARVLEASAIRVARDLEPYLPRILWMYQMGLILFWIYDRSPGQARTHTLVRKSAAIVERLVKLAAFPLMRPVRRMVADLMRTVTEES